MKKSVSPFSSHTRCFLLHAGVDSASSKNPGGRGERSTIGEKINEAIAIKVVFNADLGFCTMPVTDTVVTAWILMAILIGGSMEPVFKAFMSEPSRGRSEKKIVVSDMLSAICPDPDEMLVAFFGLLMEKRHFDLIGHIAEAVRTLLDDQAGILRIRVESAADIGVIELERRRRVITEDTGARGVHAITLINPAPIAGVKIYSESICWDGSVTGRLVATQKKLSLPLGAP